MMAGHGPVMWAIGAIGLLMLVATLLGVAALAKYVFFARNEVGGDAGVSSISWSWERPGTRGHVPRSP